MTFPLFILQKWVEALTIFRSDGTRVIELNFGIAGSTRVGFYFCV